MIFGISFPNRCSRRFKVIIITSLMDDLQVLALTLGTRIGEAVFQTYCDLRTMMLFDEIQILRVVDFGTLRKGDVRKQSLLFEGGTFRL
jgi:hypothetical protein